MKPLLDTLTLSTLGAILRASTILRFTRFHAFAVKSLEEQWSSALDDLEAQSKPGAVEVAVLGRKCGVRSVLKRAFYEMARLSGCGIDADEGEGTYVDNQVPAEESTHREAISRLDERLLGRMREHLISTWAKHATRLDPSFVCPYRAYKLRKTNPTTEQPSSTAGRHSHNMASSASTSAPAGPIPAKCSSQSSKREAWDRLVHESGVYDDYIFDPICGLQELVEIEWEKEGWCEECVRVRRAVWKRAREKLWDRIGGWMRVDE
ncbi:hypothetical protein F5I97DRAFT_1626888 [Phlebopus sp. FC_14]|nr:hypothetical protein F5I97DRAFT_1626888 [Phlebopus sp. FC_14]